MTKLGTKVAKSLKFGDAVDKNIELSANVRKVPTLYAESIKKIEIGADVRKGYS